MKLSDVISVDPGRITLGELHPTTSVPQRFLRCHAIQSPTAKRHRHRLASIVKTGMAPGAERFGGYMLLFRCLFATLLIVSGAFILSGEIVDPQAIVGDRIFAIAEIIIGALLAVGLSTRFAMAIATIFFGIWSALSISAGVFNMQCLLCTFGSLVFLLTGPGKYSCDFLISKAFVMRSLKSQRRMRADRLSYKSYKVS